MTLCSWLTFEDSLCSFWHFYIGLICEVMAILLNDSKDLRVLECVFITKHIKLSQELGMIENFHFSPNFPKAQKTVFIHTNIWFCDLLLCWMMFCTVFQTNNLAIFIFFPWKTVKCFPKGVKLHLCDSS